MSRAIELATRPSFHLAELVAALSAAVALEPLTAPHDEVTAEDCEAMDDMGSIADDMRNVLVRAEFVARIRRFDSRFGALT